MFKLIYTDHELPDEDLLAGGESHGGEEEGEGEVEEEGGDVGLGAVLLGVALDEPGVVRDLGVLGGVGPQRVMDGTVERSVGEECHWQCDHA